MRFAIEAWNPGFETGGDADALEPSATVVDPTVERSSAKWRPITPAAVAPPDRVHFVDGVRRIDARIWVEDGDRAVPGSCATVAAGTVTCTPHEARVANVHLLRGVFAPPIETADSIATDFGTYRYFAVRSGAPEDVYLGIHEQMTDLEMTTVPDVLDGDLVVFDGPLRRRGGERVVGLIKTQHVQYLDDEHHAVVRELEPGQRTPIFRIGEHGFDRWSWYLRLPGPRTHGWAGVVRAEAPGGGSAERAASLADTVTAALPRFASEPHKASRAPQNLYPIVGLEQTLRHRLGDARLLERALRTTASRSS